jgi:S-DNA-T family DNA segregation ATPase FtsK/SpoIIIE
MTLWARRGTHPDAFLAGLGLGAVPFPVASGHDLGSRAHDVGSHDAHTHDSDNHDLDNHGDGNQDVGRRNTANLTLPADLGPGGRLAVRGPQAAAVARSLLVQLAASCGPADLRMVIVTDRPAEWACLRGLPHLTQPDGSSAIIGEAAVSTLLGDLGEQPAHLLLVTDQPTLLATRTSPLRRALADTSTRALLAVLHTDEGVPHLCTSVLTTTNGPVGRWVADTRATMLPVPVRSAGIGERATYACTASLHPLIDPEDPLGVATGVPREVSLGRLLAGGGGSSLTPAGIVATWLAAGADPAPRTAIGIAADGVVDIDLVRDGPHGLIAGTTGAGKSELLRSLVVGMAAAASPAHTSFLLVDYKGGSTFDACAALPHVVGVITDLDDELADRALRSLHAELRRREAILRAHGAADLAALRSEAPEVLLPRLIVVIDEFAALVAEQPGFLHALVGVAQRGRSLGVHLLLATQRPSGVISDDIRANTNLRLALRLQDTADAHDVVGTPAPAMLPRGLPGRAVVRLGADEHVTFQTARCTAPTTGGETELQVLARAIGEAARLAGAPRPPAPWLPPLPAAVRPMEVPAGAVGLVDDPDQQRVSALSWAPGDGHLLIAGSPGAGVTSTIHTLATSVLDALGDDPDDLADVYVLDGRGSELLGSLVEHPRCAAVVRLHERERLMRMLHRLRTSARSTLAGSQAAAVVWFIDGLDALRRTLDDVDTAAEFDALEEVLADAAAARITIVAAVEHAATVPPGLLARCPNRWVMHLHDPHDATLLGVPALRVPPAAVPGRLLIAATGLVAQVTAPDRGWTGFGSHLAARRAPDIALVAARTVASDLPIAQRRAGASELPLGIEFVSGEALALHLPDDEHVLVVGGARAGRSNTLNRLADAWHEAHPHGWIGAILPRRSSTVVAHHMAADVTLLDALPDSDPALLLVDDAEAVDDPGGRLAALAAGARPGTCIVAAGRPDALRQLYGHWTTVVRRSRIGVVHTGGSELDGDLLGAVLPRRTPVPARPGLAWLVSDGRVHLLQVALAGDSQPTDRVTQSTIGSRPLAVPRPTTV